MSGSIERLAAIIARLGDGFDTWPAVRRIYSVALPADDFDKMDEAFAADLRFALSRIASLEGALEPFAAVWDWDDSPRHFPQAVYSRKGVGLNLLNDDMRRAYEALHGRPRLPNVKPDSEPTNTTEETR